MKRWTGLGFAGLLIGSLLALVTACTSDSRRQASIPQVPSFSDTVRQQHALQALEAAILRAPTADAYARRAEVYLARGEWKAAINDLDEAIAKADNVGDYYLLRALGFRQQQLYAKALADAQRAEILGVNVPQLYTLEADILLQQQQFQRAELYVNRALSLAPFDGDAYAVGALYAAYRGDTALAFQRYQQAVQLKPRLLEPYYQLAGLYRTKRNPNAALHYLNEAARYFPANARLTYSRGLVYHTIGRADSAMACYRQTLALQADYYPAYFQVGLLWQSKRRYADALTNYQEVKRLKPQFPHIDTYVGFCFEQLRQFTQAQQSYAAALQANPADKQAAAGWWRIKRRQSGQNPYNSVFLPYASGGSDTGRIKWQPIRPRMRLPSAGSDSVR